jgi:hypothetical protein
MEAYYDADRDQPVECGSCDHTGRPMADLVGSVVEFNCTACGNRISFVGLPTVSELKMAAARGNRAAKREAASLARHQAHLEKGENFQLKEPVWKSSRTLNSQDATRDDLSKALGLAREAIDDRFVIIERSGQEYMQCVCENNGWLLEKREGSHERHFRASFSNSQEKGNSEQSSMMDRIFSPKLKRGLYLDFDQVEQAMLCYLRNKPDPKWLQWDRFEVPEI